MNSLGRIRFHRAPPANVSHLQVLSQPRGVHSLRNNDCASLDAPTQQHLRATRVAALRDLHNRSIVRKLELPDRRIGGKEDPARLAEGEQLVLRERRVELHLVDGGNDFGVRQEFGQGLDTEVGDPDGPYRA